MIAYEVLNPLILSAFTKEITWLEASSRHSLDEFIETFFQTRERTHDRLEGLTDEQASFASDVHPFWSISESITHLIHSQGFYHNMLLELSTTQLPHVVEAARGFGEGAKQNIPAGALRQSLREATDQVRAAIEATRSSYDPKKVVNSPLFGACGYKTWVLLLLAHEVDHLRQIAAMRSLARTNT